MNSKKILSILLAVLVFVLPLGTAVSAAADPTAYNQKVSALAAELETRFNITISYPVRSDGYAAVGTVTLGMLKQSLDYITPQVVGQISDFFLGIKGKKIEISYVYPPQDFEAGLGIQLASFTSEAARLQIFIPRHDGQMTISGNSPTAVIHEFGHAFQDFIEHKHGANNLKNQWLGYNDGYSYEWGRSVNPSATSFASDYASNDYYEDFAETFAQCFLANRDGLGIADRLSKNGNRTGLGKKVAMVEALLPMYMTNTEKALENIRKIYFTKTNVLFNGVKLTGNSLEYIGFPEPNGVSKGVLKSIGLQAASCEWHREIGGWYVVTTAGETYLAFPGAQYTRFPPIKKAA